MSWTRNLKHIIEKGVRALFAEMDEEKDACAGGGSSAKEASNKEKESTNKRCRNQVEVSADLIHESFATESL